MWSIFFVSTFKMTHVVPLLISHIFYFAPIQLPPPPTRPDLGGAYGTAMAGKGIMAMGVRSPELLMKNIIPVVMAGVLGIYGLM